MNKAYFIVLFTEPNHGWQCCRLFGEKEIAQRFLRCVQAMGYAKVELSYQTCLDASDAAAEVRHLHDLQIDEWEEPKIEDLLDIMANDFVK